jgi:hypothetical protein
MSTTTLNDVTYTTAAKVSALLGVSTFSATTIASSTNAPPNQGEVEDFIIWAEDEINQRTNHSWKAVTVTDEVYDVPRRYIHGFWRREMPLHLNHRALNTFTSGTHKIEIWDGQDWKDLILTANGYTEGRGDDYWIDYGKGIIYFVDQRPYFSENGVRVTYAYGESSVPADIERAATLLAAIHLLQSDDYRNIFPEGTDKYPVQPKAEVWRKEIDNILSRRSELMLI